MKLIDPKNLPKKWVKATNMLHGNCKIKIKGHSFNYVHCKPEKECDYSIYMGIYFDVTDPSNIGNLFFRGHGHSYRDMLEFILKEVNDNDSL